MPNYQPYQGTKKPEWADASKALIENTPGIFKGEIKKIDSATRSGRLYVYIDGFGTASSNDPGGWTLVDYASPFSGKTLGTGIPNKQNDFSNTKQTYGFFMTPPDIGNIVLCCFPNGDRTSGYWFACVNPNLGKGMVPSIGSVPLDRIDPVSVPAELVPFLKPGNSYPAGEFNENDDRVFSSNWATDALRPLHIPQFFNLVRQGLQDDQQGRGPITSSVQRDPVSSVFGFSTPGRPTNDPALSNTEAQLQAKLSSGEFDPTEFVARNRVGGHSLTMDDGDVYGKSNLVKLKSAAGHQIFMNDTDGFMYIANSTGTAWIELTKEGDILVFGQRDFSLRTFGNIMMHTGRSVSINAGTFDVKAKAMRVETQSTVINSEGSVLVRGVNTSIQGLAGVNVVGAQVGVTAAGPLSLKGLPISLNGGVPSGLSSLSNAPAKLPQYSLNESLPSGEGWSVNAGLLKSINYRVPTHEPYIRGNVAAVVAQQQSIIDSLASTPQPDRAIDGVAISPASTSRSLTRGTDQAIGIPIDPAKTASTSTFISQPTPIDSLGKLNRTELRAYFAQTGFTESAGTGGYTAVNQFGYQGKYQLGSAALQDLGYVKPGTAQTPEAMSNPNNWTGKNGVTSSAAFLAAPAVQEQVMYDYTKNNYARLQKSGTIAADTPTDEIAGLLSASHLVGPGSVNTWVKTGKDVADANGVTLTSYYNQGRYSQTQVPIIQTSNNSKIIGETSQG